MIDITKLFYAVNQHKTTLYPLIILTYNSYKTTKMREGTITRYFPYTLD
jgi:hypothetical protein